MKGSRAAIGDENVAANGYHYVKTSTGWRLKHHVVKEEAIGRPLRPDERVSFKDKDRTNFQPDNLVITQKQPTSTSNLNKRLTTIQDRMISFIEASKDPETAMKELRELLEDLNDVYG